MNKLDQKLIALLYYLKLYPIRTLILGVLILLCGAFEFFSLSAFVPVLEYINAGEGVVSSSSRLNDIIVSFLGWFNLKPTLIILLGFALVVSLLQFLLSFFQNILTAYLFFPVRKNIRDNCFCNLMESSLKYYSDKKTGHLVNVMTERIDTVGYAISCVVQLVADVVLVAVYLAFAFLVSWQVSLMVLAVGIIKHFATLPFMVWAKKIGHDWVEAGNAQTNKLIESLNGIRVIKSFSREQNEISKFRQLTHNFCKIQATSAVNQEYMKLVDNVIAPILFVVIIYLSIEVFNISSSLVLIYLFALMRLVPKLSKINANRNLLSTNLANAYSILELLDRDNKPSIVSGEKILTSEIKTVSFDKVGFAYRSEQKVLNNISFTISKKERVAIVGASGSGKSTLVNLLLHLYDPVSGQINIDGVDLRQLDIASWQAKLGFVDQDTFLFNDTVYNNILYGKLDASESEVIAAAKKAHLHEVIMAMENGYQTMLGERGVKLSGGQRQRMAIARALIRQPEILIFDEATSALDSISEKNIQQSIDELSHHCTMVLIAHRLSTIMNSDKIIVLDNGGVVETGKHDELIKAGGKYAEYCKAQLKDNAPLNAGVK